MNIIIIRRCSNCCPYCFETGERDHSQKDLLDLQDARALAAWSVKAGVESIGILGGEPFLHPNLRGIIDAFRLACPNVPRTVFTGGVVNPGNFDHFEPADFGLLFNINEVRDYVSLAVADQVIDNVDRAISNGFDVTLGFNVWRIDFDTTFMPRLAYKMGRTGFRWAVANPMWGVETHVVRPDYFKELSQQCFKMLHEATALGLRCTLDCHLPLCFFSDEQLAWLVQHQPQTIEGLGTCNTPIDVTPELEAIRCFATSNFYRAQVLDFPNESTLKSHFRERVDKRLQISNGILPECAVCHAFTSNRCQGGCLGWRDATVRYETPNPAKHVFELLQAGKAEEAFELVTNTSRRFQTPLCLYLGAMAAQSLGNMPAAYQYAGQALSYTKDDSLRHRIIDFLKILGPYRSLLESSWSSD